MRRCLDGDRPAGEPPENASQELKAIWDLVARWVDSDDAESEHS